MERTVACLRKAIHDKEFPLKVAETRLEERTRRVDVELCKDPAMQGSVFRDIAASCSVLNLLKHDIRGRMQKSLSQSLHARDCSKHSRPTVTKKNRGVYKGKWTQLTGACLQGGKWTQLASNLTKGEKNSPADICGLIYEELYQFQR